MADALTARGHENVSLVEDFAGLMGHAQAIRVLPDHLEAAADPRSDGAGWGSDRMSAPAASRSKAPGALPGALTRLHAAQRRAA